MKKNIKLLTIFTFAIILAAFACTNYDASKSNENSSSPATSIDKQTYRSTGVVKAIDKTNEKITIDHDDIPGYMTAMEMNESVGDPQMLEKAKVGDKVEFEIERTGSKIVVTKINKIGEVALLNGNEIYQANCATCHGANGEGAKKGIPLISGHALHHSEDEYIKQVTNGEGNKMPAFKDKLKPEEIAEVVKFVRTEIQKNSPKEEKDDDHHHH